jgi:GINS complex subunit 2
MSICQRSSFSAESTPITVVPAFSSPKAPLTLLSSPHQQSVGPFVAGMPVAVPLWMAKLLYQKQLAQIQLPEWLSVDRLTAILREEKTSELLTGHLPFYYYEIARSLTGVLNQGKTDGGSGQQQAALVVLQDLVAVRIDKIRQNFHELSRETLVHVADDLPMIAVTGIASVELNKIGPFLQRAFSDYGYLIQQSQEEVEEEGVEAGAEKEGAEAASDGLEKGGSKGVVKKAAMARSRLRRFRQ